MSQRTRRAWRQKPPVKNDRAVNPGQEQLDTRALERATEADTKADALVADVHRLGGDISTMRKENTQSHNAVREAINSGLGRIHGRINKMAWSLIVGLVCALLGVIAWGFAYFVVG